MNFSDNYNNLKSKTENLDNYSYEELLNLLDEAKNRMKEYENLQLIVKRNGNSLYGVSASIYFSLCDVDIAEDITMTAKHFAVIVDRAINKFFVNWDEQELNIIKQFYPDVIKLRKFTEYIPDTKKDICVYGDTDSRYIDLGLIYSLLITEKGEKKLPESDKELADFGCFIVKNFIDEIIADTIQKDLKERNGRLGYLKMNHEVTTRRCCFQKKKKYCMVPIWSDGKYVKPKIKYKGLDIKRGTSSPRIKKILGILLEKFMLHNFDESMIRKECLKLIQYIKVRKEKDLIYQITTVSGLKEINKNQQGIYISDKNHIQMQIALNWMNFITENNLQSEYKIPFEGQKMNYYYCVPESKYKVIGVPDDIDINLVEKLPEVDWDKMLRISFIKPLLRIIMESDDISDIVIDNFIAGVKVWNFSK
jgi:hypothetical protein